jgi:hypothetical protein
MPLERSNAILDLSNPNIVLGPRKHRPTERLLDNRDPLACKKGRRVTVSDDSVNRDKLRPSSASPSMPPSSQSTALTDSAEDSHDKAIVVGDSNKEGSERCESEVTDEDDDAELGM